jgi:acetyltransferase-like isoleucine patch superfamily enzyme
VLTADKVYISDNQHTYDNPDIPIQNQPIKQCKTIIIKEGSWIGENVCIIGACIGKNSVIGANSFVTHDIPDYTIAVGAPARVIKKYNFKTRKWEKVE